MGTYGVAIAPNRFACGFYRQVWWSWLIGSAFFFGEIGAGLFLVSLLSDHWVGMAVGYLIVMVGKNTAHLLYLGRPERFWRAAMRPDRSWIARGLWATGLLATSGFVLLLPHMAGREWELGGWAGTLVYSLAVVSAVFIMFYDGFVMSFSPAIPFWHTKLLPLLCFTYAALGGTTLSLALRELLEQSLAQGSLLLRLEYTLLVTNLALLVIYVSRMSRWLPAARETARLLLRGAYAGAFLGLVVLVGLVATLLLSLLHGRYPSTWVVISVAACELTGDFALLMVLLKSGLFSPQEMRVS
ncbi:MAG: NrfD/PsrC family molybdoenzyme membrane anchor subunit [Acidobacteriota bacterium]